MINNIVRELPVTLNEIKKEVENDDFILDIKKTQLNDQKVQEIYSICAEFYYIVRE